MSLMKINKIVDNTWNVGMVRADKTGVTLADTIYRKVQGGRSISLIGHGLAARAIYTCLMSLAERRAFGIIDSVVLFGAPAPSDNHVWLTLKSVVAGRLVNVYSDKDYMLAFMMRLSNTEFSVSGLQPITKVSGVENYDAGQMAGGHLMYRYAMGKILRKIGWQGLDSGQLVKDEAALREMEEKHSHASDIVKPDSGKGRAEKGEVEGDWQNSQPAQGHRGGSIRRGRRGGNRRNGGPKWVGKSTTQS